MNILYSIPTQARQLCYIGNGSDTAEICDKTFQRSGVVFFRISKSKARLLDNTTAFALKPGNLYYKLNFPFADRKHFESARKLAESCDITGFTVLTLQIVGMNRTMEDGLTFKKTTFLYCTVETPKV